MKSVIYVPGRLNMLIAVQKIGMFFFAAQSVNLIIFFLTTDAVTFGSAHFGAGVGSIHLDEVGCTGNETTLISCHRASHQQSQCRYGHWEDAGVRCQSMFTCTG